MSQILRGILFIAYASFFIHILKHLHSEKTVIEIEYIDRPTGTAKKIMKEIRKNRNNVNRNTIDTFERSKRLPTDLKYILKWTKGMTHYSNPDFVNGQKSFLDKDCKFVNCFITNEKSLLTDVRYFDAIIFDVENDWDDHPHVRSLDQRYIFSATEPAGLFPICDPLYESYYNVTWSYRLDSTIPQPFFNIYFNNGTIAGPKMNMNWRKSPRYPIIPIQVKLARKKKLAAWFVSHCKTKSKREVLVADISRYLQIYNFSIDIYGWCGNHKCPKDDLNTCLTMLQNDYYFYLAFENSLDEDYVTEKVLHALNSYTVPIVYGGADYSRFLPPNSYINARDMTPGAQASLMIELSKNRESYLQYFLWHHTYYYKANSLGSNICQLCQMLNEPQQTTRPKNFTSWWNTDGDCQKLDRNATTDVMRDF